MKSYTGTALHTLLQANVKFVTASKANSTTYWSTRGNEVECSSNTAQCVRASVCMCMFVCVCRCVRLRACMCVLSKADPGYLATPIFPKPPSRPKDKMCSLLPLHSRNRILAKTGSSDAITAPYKGLHQCNFICMQI